MAKFCEVCRQPYEPATGSHFCTAGFPLHEESSSPIYPHNMTETQWLHELAARAMEGVQAKIEPDGTALREGIAKEAYALAKAMIAEGKKHDTPKD